MESTPADASAITTIAGVIAKMQKVDASLPRKDGMASSLREMLALEHTYADVLARTTEVSSRAILV